MIKRGRNDTAKRLNYKLLAKSTGILRHSFLISGPMKNTSQLHQLFTHFPRKHLLLLGLVSAIVLIMIFIPRPAELDRITLPLDLSENSGYDASFEEEPPEDQPALPELIWKEETVRSGDTLSLIFQRAGIPATVLHRLTNTENGKQLAKIFPGQTLHFAFNDDNELVQLRYQISRLEQLEFVRDENGSFIAEKISKLPDIQINYHQAVLEDSLFMAGQRAGMSQGMIMQVSEVFSGVIDFILDPRRGDTFDILFEEKYLDGEKIGNGNLLATSYRSSRETFTAYRYEFADGKVGYYSPEGISMRKAFLRAPLDVFRISSNFNLRRQHPVHKKIVAHRGTDYAAPTGTPVFAAGDGRVTKSGYSAANGNYVFIAHGSSYVTKYLHLHQRYVKTGQVVKQRQTIGTVGSTGYSTGPHLHYEFLVDGVHRDPRTIASRLPSADPIPKAEMPRFLEQIRPLQTLYQHHQQLATKE